MGGCIEVTERGVRASTIFGYVWRKLSRSPRKSIMDVNQLVSIRFQPSTSNLYSNASFHGSYCFQPWARNKFNCCLRCMFYNGYIDIVGFCIILIPYFYSMITDTFLEQLMKTKFLFIARFLEYSFIISVDYSYSSDITFKNLQDIKSF